MLILGLVFQCSSFAQSTTEALEKKAWDYIIEKQLEKADSAAYMLFKTIQQEKNVSDTVVAKAYYLLGTVEYYKARYRISANFYEKSLVLDYVVNTPSLRLRILNNLGATLSYLGKLPEALNTYQTALQISKDQNNKEAIINLSINIADLEYDLGNYKSAIKLAEDIMDAELSPESRSSCHLNLGKYYISDNQLEKGLRHTMEALKQFEALEDPYYTTAALINLAKIQQKKKELSASDKTIQKALDIARKNNYDKFIAPALIHLSQNTILSGRNLSKAKDYALEALRLTRESGIRDHLEEATLELSKYYAAVNDMDLFLQTIEAFNTVKKETESLKAKDAAEEFKVIYEVDQLTKEVDFLHDNIQTKNRQLLLTVLISILATLGGSIIFLQNRRLQQNIKTMFKMNVNLAYADHGASPESDGVDMANGSLEEPQESDAELYRLILRKIELKGLYKDPQLTIHSLSKYLKCNRTMVSRAIKNAGRTNFAGMINEFKVNEARRLIMEKGSVMSISNIALEAGFTSRTSFNRHFKDLTGFTPTAYLEMFSKSITENEQEVED